MLQMVFRRGLSEIGGAEVRTVSGLRDYDAGEHCDQPVSSLLVKGCSHSCSRVLTVERLWRQLGPRQAPGALSPQSASELRRGGAKALMSLSSAGLSHPTHAPQRPRTLPTARGFCCHQCPFVGTHFPSSLRSHSHWTWTGAKVPAAVILGNGD